MLNILTAFAAEYIKNPQTSYAQDFVTKSEEQKWFLDEVETILQQQNKSINTLNSKEDFEFIFTLGASNKELEGKVPKAIGEIYNLKYLYLSDNNLSGDLPNELYSLVNLINLDISNNNISGNISSQISNLHNLEILLLHNNGLTGEIPDSFGSLKNLINLDLSYNDLSGEIPTSITSCNNLIFLALSNNSLTNSIPEEMNNLNNLKTLYLWNNELSGEIINTLSNLESLENLDLSENKLTGILGESFDNLDHIKLLDISSNCFVGDISEKLADKINDDSNPADIYVNSNYMFGENLMSIESNEDNFLDGFKNDQNRLFCRNTIYVPRNSTINLIDHLITINPDTYAVKRSKIELEPQYFEYRLSADTLRNYGSQIKMRVNPNGSIQLDSSVDSSEERPIIIELLIKANEGSEYSIVRFKIVAVNPQTQEDDSDGYSFAPLSSGGYDTTSSNQNITVKEEIPLGAINPDLIKYISGYEDGTFRPNIGITREEMAFIIFSLYGSGISSNIDTKYIDVENDRWSSNAIKYVTNAGIMIGYPDNTFKPRNELSRAETTVIISKLKQLGLDKDSEFLDSKNHWASKYIDAVNKAGYMVGYPDGSFKPDNNITRAEIVTAMNKVFEREVDKDFINNSITNPFSDLDKSHWAYYEILDATYDKEETTNEE